MNDIEEKLARAKKLLEENRNEEARIMLLEVVKDSPENTTALLMLGGCYFYDKKYAEAEMVYERLILIEPGSGMLSIALFNSLWNQGRHEEAAEEIRRFISVADKVQERDTIEQYAEISKAIAEGRK